MKMSSRERKRRKTLDDQSVHALLLSHETILINGLDCFSPSERKEFKKKYSLPRNFEKPLEVAHKTIERLQKRKNEIEDRLGITKLDEEWFRLQERFNELTDKPTQKTEKIIETGEVSLRLSQIFLDLSDLRNDPCYMDIESQMDQQRESIKNIENQLKLTLIQRIDQMTTEIENILDDHDDDDADLNGDVGQSEDQDYSFVSSEYDSSNDDDLDKH